MKIVNLAGYKFVAIEARADWCGALRERCTALQLRGTVLLAPEGINLFVAGSAAAIDAFVAYLGSAPRFGGKLADMSFKRSLSAEQPFKRMLVKLKKEIITMKRPAIRPAAGRAPAVDPATLKKWLDRGHDDAGRPLALLDTRNAFEVDVGTFAGALDWRLDKFSDFPARLEQRRGELEGKTVVSFCTGGIRCEKAALHLHEVGIEHVYQLDGGILGYFDQIGGAHYHGDCFVFDSRSALDPALQPAAPAVSQPIAAARSASGAMVQAAARQPDHQ